MCVRAHTTDRLECPNTFWFGHYYKNWWKSNFIKSYPSGEVTARWCPDTTVSFRSVSDHFGMDGARNTVVQFCVQFGQLVCCKGNSMSILSNVQLINLLKLTGINTSISYVTNCSCFNNVTNNKFLDCLVFGHTACAVGATHRLNVSTTMLWSSSITALTSLELIKIYN